MYTDLIGPITQTGYNSSKYCLFLIDDAIRIIKDKLLKFKF